MRNQFSLVVKRASLGLCNSSITKYRVALYKLLSLSEPSLSHLYNRDNIISSFRGFLGLNKVVSIKHFYTVHKSSVSCCITAVIITLIELNNFLCILFSPIPPI